MSTVYYVIDTSIPQSAGFLTSMEAVHKAGARQAELSVAIMTGDRALVKVKGDQSMLNKPDPRQVIIQEFDSTMDAERLAFYYANAVVDETN